MPKIPLSLAILLAVVATGVMTWLSKESNNARKRGASVAIIESNEGIVQFEQTLNVPVWLKMAIGEEHFRDEKVIDFATNRGRKAGTNEPKATDETLKHLASLTHVETLELGNHYELTDSDLAFLPPLKNLTTLYLYRTGIRGPGLVHLEQLPKLESLSLDYTDVDDSGTKHLGNMPSLASLRLDNTKVTDAGMADVAKAWALTMLSLNNTDVTDVGLMQLDRLHGLKVLDVSSTRVAAEGVARLQKALPGCRIRATFGLGVMPQDELLFTAGSEPTPSEINAKLKELGIDGEVMTDATRPGNPIVSLRLFSCISQIGSSSL